MNGQRLEQLARQWRNFATVRAAGFLYVAACLGAIPLALHPAYLWIVLPLAVLLAALIGYQRSVQSRRLNAAQIARHLDRTHPELEESSHLWLRPTASLTLLERLQLDRLNHAADRLADTLAPRAGLGHPPRYVRSTILYAFAGSVLLLAVIIGVAFRRTHPASFAVAATAPRAALATPAPPAPRVWPKITGGGLTITPPAYTGHPPRQTTGFNTEVEENAAVSWRLALDRPVREAHLVFGPTATDFLPLQPTTDHAFQATRTVAETSLYTLAATLPDGTAWAPPEVYSLKVIKDQPPTLRILQPVEARTVIVPAPVPPSNDSLPPSSAPHTASCFVEVQAGDDYGLADAHLVATVAKGSGEAVKFREQTIPFDGDNEDAPSPGLSTTHRFTKTLDLAALGLKPGDELYFYVEARDNRQPTPNRTRSETRFLVLQGPDKPSPTQGRGVAGVNLVPQYFRSERQLIIDTEKLLADRPTLPDKEFRSRANDLGADQALLRLRYGQFLGEDQEDGPATDHTEVSLDPLQAHAPPRAPGPHAAASIAQQFQQEHEAQDSEGGSEESRDANLRPAPTTPLSADQIRQPYVDSHDTQDKATYFDQQSKGTMKDALSAMWAAEGSLRIAQPQDALAPEHRALDILKELQQSARAYVQHVGFDAPPLKIEERRLKGDATGAPDRLPAPNEVPPPDSARVAVRAALAALPLAGPLRADTLRRVEPILTAAATRRPDDFLPGLQSLRRLLADGSADAADLPPLERALLRLLPPANPLPTRAPDAAPIARRALFPGPASWGGKAIAHFIPWQYSNNHH